jgi:hypothetical protein
LKYPKPSLLPFRFELFSDEIRLHFLLKLFNKATIYIFTSDAFILIHSEKTENGITKMLCFGAFGVVPSHQINKKFGVSAMYLEGQTHLNMP